WKRGITLAYLSSLKRYWEEEWSYARLLEKLERYRHYTVEIEEVDVQFVHVRSPREDAVPLLLCHGWPEKVLEFQKVVKPLSEPDEPAASAFHLVIPSLAGFIFSGPQPLEPRRYWEGVQYAYDGEVPRLGRQQLPSTVRGGCGYGRPVLVDWHDPQLRDDVLREPVRPRRMASYAKTWQGGNQCLPMGYSVFTRTASTTVGYALYDSPLGTLSWIGEKYHGWVDNNHPLPLEEIVDTAALYHLKGTFHTSALTYYENRHGVSTRLPGQKHGKTAISAFRYDILYSPERWSKRFADVVFYKCHPAGGHFAALEQPE
ncbi:alpha/beta-hydrolase, partial [Calocera cornea HHB12733]